MLNSTNMSFASFLRRSKEDSRMVILDGAVGTELDNRGAGLTSPLWSGRAPLDTPQLLGEIHRSYASAGADILTACTFRTTLRTFQKAGLYGEEWREAVIAAVNLTRNNAPDGRWIAGSVAPLEDCFRPREAPWGDEAFQEHYLLCEALVAAGVDVLWLETFGTLGEMAAAMKAARIAGKGAVPFTVSVTTNAEGNLISGESLVEANHMAEADGATAFCVNCIPVSHLERALPLLKQHASIPIGAYANLGFAESSQDWHGSAHLAPEEYARVAKTWQLDILGGCCGSTPAHIRALREL